MLLAVQAEGGEATDFRCAKHQVFILMDIVIPLVLPPETFLRAQEAA